MKNIKAAPMVEWLRWLISLCPLIIWSSHRCDLCGQEPHMCHMWDKSGSACEYVVFTSPTDIGLSRYEWRGERGGLMVSASDSGARGRGFDTYLRRVVSLSKIHSLPKSTCYTQEAVAPSGHDWNIVY